MCAVLTCTSNSTKVAPAAAACRKDSTVFSRKAGILPSTAKFIPILQHSHKGSRSRPGSPPDELASSTQSDCTGSLRAVRAQSGFVSCTRHGIYTTASATKPTLCGLPMPTCQGWGPEAARCPLWVTPGEADAATCVRSAGAVPLQKRVMRPTTAEFADLNHSWGCRATVRGASFIADGAGYRTAAQIGSAEIHAGFCRPHLHALMDQMI